MRLLVSVRSAAEAAAAVAGGADVVDAKEPSRGSLGPVAPEALGEIARAVPDALPLSVALGDVSHAADASRAVEAVRVTERSLPVYLKLGFAGVTDHQAIAAALRAAVSAAGGRSPAPMIIAVAYADHAAARTVAPTLVATIAAEESAAGVLVDTHIKDGRDLLHWLPRPELDGWLDRVHQDGLTAAIAGSLQGDRLASLAGTSADVIGVRGAVCRGGRKGAVVTSLVRETRRLLTLRTPQAALS